MRHYKHRVADELLQRKLLGKGAVLVQGPKWCGKTTTAKQIANSLLDLGNTISFRTASEKLQILPYSLLDGDVPRLIDEWQMLPELWDMIRNEVDNRGEMGQFILTGSSVPLDESKRHHSGTGRYGWINMRPMSLWESGESTGSVSLGSLFEGENIAPTENPLQIGQIAFLLCRGGWPQATFMKDDVALSQARDYYETIYKIDIHRVDKTNRNSERTSLYREQEINEIPLPGL